jgi:hypothetical protein
MSPEPPGAKGTTMVTGPEVGWAMAARAHPGVAAIAQKLRLFMASCPSA